MWDLIVEGPKKAHRMWDMTVEAGKDYRMWDMIVEAGNGLSDVGFDCRSRKRLIEGGI